LPASGFTNTKLATKEAGEPDHAGSAGGHSVWFSWTPSSSGPVEISGCPYNEGGIDTLLAVYTGGAVGGLTPVASNDDDAAGCSARASVAELAAVAGTTYRIAVDGKAGSQGIFSLEIHNALPENDDFADAEELSPTPLFANGFTKHATKEAGEPDHAGEPGGHSVWYSWTPSAGGNVAVTACTDTFDPVLAIYTGIAVGNLTPVATTDTDSDDCDQGSSLEFAATAGTPYRFAVDGAGGDDGHFELLLESVAASPRSLTVNKAGGGAGSVTSSPAGIACGSTCNHDFEEGTVVTLIAHPDSGSFFAGWLGGGCAGMGACQVTLSAATTVVANFQAPSSGGRGGVPPGPGLTPQPPPKPPLKCKSRFNKVRIKGKPKCVKMEKPSTVGARASTEQSVQNFNTLQIIDNSLSSD
jgi:hypothetical protein